MHSSEADEVDVLLLLFIFYFLALYYQGVGIITLSQADEVDVLFFYYF